MLTKQIIDNFASGIKDLCFPPACLLCHSSLKDSSILICSDCLRTLTFSSSPMCPKCGRVFVSREGEDHLCSACRRDHLFYEQARSLFVYDRHCAPLIHALKYGGCTAGLKTFAGLKEIYGAGADLSPSSLIIPVPLHRRRLRRRGFNQAVLLAKALFPKERHMVDPFLLQRVQDTRPQTSLSGERRRQNLKTAFEVRGRKRIAGLNILLVDDVLTTGTTVNECARALTRAGAGRIEVFTLARVME